MLLQAHSKVTRCSMYYLVTTEPAANWPHIQSNTRLYTPTVTLFGLEETAEAHWGGRPVLVGRYKTTHLDKLGILPRELP